MDRFKLHKLLTYTKGDVRTTYINNIGELLANEGISINRLAQDMHASYSCTHGIVSRPILDTTPLSRLGTMASILGCDISDLYTTCELTEVVGIRYLNTIRRLIQIYDEHLDGTMPKLDVHTTGLAQMLSDEVLFTDTDITDKDAYLVLNLDNKLVTNADDLLHHLYCKYQIEIRQLLIVHYQNKLKTRYMPHDELKAYVSNIIQDDNEQCEVLFYLT